MASSSFERLGRLNDWWYRHVVLGSVVIAAGYVLGFTLGWYGDGGWLILMGASLFTFVMAALGRREARTRAEQQSRSERPPR